MSECKGYTIILNFEISDIEKKVLSKFWIVIQIQNVLWCLTLKANFNQFSVNLFVVSNN